jgi:phosphatidylglycerophosphate synthase
MAQGFDRWFRRRIEPHVPSWVTPDMITVFGFGIGLSAGLLHDQLGRTSIAWGVAAGLWLGIGKVFDAADGALARTRQQFSKWGWLIDSTTDKVLVATLLLWNCDAVPGWWRWIAIGIDAALFLLRPVEIHLNAPTGANRWGGAKVHFQAWGIGAVMTGWTPGVLFGTWILLSMANLLALGSLVGHGRGIATAWQRRRISPPSSLATQRLS